MTDTRQDGPKTGDEAERAEPFRDVFLSAPDGLRLHARDYPPAARPDAGTLPVVCLPGLTRNVRDFHEIALRLAGDAARPRRVVALDYRGRGQSEWDRDPGNYTIAVEAEDVLAAMAALDIDKAAFIGTSRGALIIHILAGMRPGVLAAAVLNDAGPVVDGAGLARIKGYLERMPRPRDWADAVRILKDAHGKSFPRLDEADWTEMARAIYQEGKKGGLVTDYDPALVKLLKDVDFNTRLPTLWPQFDALGRIPVMTIRGALSTLLSQETVDEMKRRQPQMRVIIAEGQGHPPLLHRDGIEDEIAAFLASADTA